MLDRLDELQDVGVDRKRFPTVDDDLNSKRVDSFIPVIAPHRFR